LESLRRSNTELVAYAKSYVARGWRIGNAAELAAMLESAFSGGVHLVVPVDDSENMRVLVDELHPVAPGA
jgi:thiamine pyrophosphate-dependent acetolactate synthase large subunit-like protein